MLILDRNIKFYEKKISRNIRCSFIHFSIIVSPIIVNYFHHLHDGNNVKTINTEIIQELPKAELPKAETPYELVMKKQSAMDAFNFSSQYMNDEYNTSSIGTQLFALWSVNNLKWKDIQTIKNETSYARIQKNIDLERGKLICITSTIIQIEASADNGLYFGLMHNNEGLWHFYAVHSTGDLVQDSRSKFCGFVTGKFDYSNSGGGTGHAIDLVGMFDLLENKK